MSQSAADRKRAQRKRDRSQGYVEIVVKVPACRVKDARRWCALLAPKGARKRKPDERQMDLIDYIDGEQYASLGKIGSFVQ
ncbi:MAG: hypothetical protein E5Y31_20975 [Mesorhizobium sp.]|nr:MAG: hypothetical protein E5Y31_20975 [Mesorhizobium sp.]